MRSKLKSIALGAVAALAAGFLLIQLVPYGRDHTNPPVTSEPAWDSPRTRELAKRACFDCHSHETTWPVYASVAPFSWLVQDHVEEGRLLLNFSTWATAPGEESHEAAEVLTEGEMPPAYYTLLHPSARLTEEETRALAAGLEATIGGDGEVAREAAHGEEG